MTNTLEKPEHINILVVEDNPESQLMMKIILSKSGYQVQTAENGQVALDLLQKQHNHFNLVLMDIQMPVMDGLEATRAIRQIASPEVSAVPVVAVTAYSDDDNRNNCLEAGMNGFIGKPVRTESLLQTVKDYLAENIR